MVKGLARGHYYLDDCVGDTGGSQIVAEGVERGAEFGHWTEIVLPVVDALVRIDSVDTGTAALGCGGEDDGRFAVK